MNKTIYKQYFCQYTNNIDHFSLCYIPYYVYQNGVKVHSTCLGEQYKEVVEMECSYESRRYHC